MKKFFRFGKNKKDGANSATASTESLAATGYLVKEKDVSKLHKAAWTGDINKVRSLAKKDPSAFDKENRTPLHLASARGHTAVVQELLEWKAKVNVADNEKRSPLMKAVECGHEDCTRLLLDARADTNSYDRHGDSALHYAAQNGSIPMATMLLAIQSTDIDAKNNDGHSALHYAVMHKYDKLAEFLLEEGCDLDVQDNDGRTAVMLAVQDGSIELTSLLLQFRPDINIKDSKGWRADDIAIITSHDACKDLLAEFAGRQPDSQRPAIPGHQVALQGQDKGTDDIPGLGAPAVDQGDDFSAAEETESKMSEAAGGVESWADSDDQSEIDNKKKKIPNLDLSKLLKDSNEALDDTDGTSKIPKLNPNQAASSKMDVKRSESSTSAGKSRIPISQRDSVGGLHAPVSARSSTSAKSALSFGNVDSNWSDEDSLFSSANNPKHKKPGLLKLGATPQGKDDDPKTEPASEWSDDESHPIGGNKAEKDINAIPATPRGSEKNQGAVSGSGTSTKKKKVPTATLR